MYLAAFHLLFPDIADRETRTLTITNGYMGVPNDTYGLLESYCPDPQCDCQRVMLNIFSQAEQRQVATISYGFDRSARDAGPYLDPLNPQEKQSTALLKLMTVYLAQDTAYVARLKSHYAMVKTAAADPQHPVQKILQQWNRQENDLVKTDQRVKSVQTLNKRLSEAERAFKRMEERARSEPRKRIRKKKPQ